MEAYNLPIKLREWFVKRLVKQKEDESEAMKNASKGGSSQGPPTQLGASTTPPGMPDPSK